MRRYGDWTFIANDLRLVGLLEDANEVIALFARCAHRENEDVSKFFQLLSESWEFYFLLVVVGFYFWGLPLFFFCLSSLQGVFYKLVDKILVSSRVRVSEGFYVVFASCSVSWNASMFLLFLENCVLHLFACLPCFTKSIFPIAVYLRFIGLFSFLGL